jgi:hypothetical protein
MYSVAQWTDGGALRGIVRPPLPPHPRSKPCSEPDELRAVHAYIIESQERACGVTRDHGTERLGDETRRSARHLNIVLVSPHLFPFSPGLRTPHGGRGPYVSFPSFFIKISDNFIYTVGLR